MHVSAGFWVIFSLPTGNTLDLCIYLSLLDSKFPFFLLSCALYFWKWYYSLLECQQNNLFSMSSVESLVSIFLQFTPYSFRLKNSMNGLSPLKDTLIVPEDVAEPPLVQKQNPPPPSLKPDRLIILQILVINIQKWSHLRWDRPVLKILLYQPSTNPSDKNMQSSMEDLMRFLHASGPRARR